ncbi:hypothetical protein YN1_5320 [Nanoarchaeota archaeon]
MVFRFANVREFRKFRGYLKNKIKDYEIKKEDIQKIIYITNLFENDIDDLLLYLKETGKSEIFEKFFNFIDEIVINKFIINVINQLYSTNLNKEKIDKLRDISILIDIRFLEIIFDILDNKENIDEKINEIKKLGKEARELLEEILST